MKDRGQASQFQGTFVHPVRLRMPQLMLGGDYTAGRLAEARRLPSRMASEHLRIMRHCGLLGRRQDGHKTHCQVAGPSLQPIAGCIERRLGVQREERQSLFLKNISSYHDCWIYNHGLHAGHVRKDRGS
jgi:hypothetical protein